MNTLAAGERFHALDNLRAIMMWLGVVLHVAINHITSEAPTPWRDHDVSPLADFIFVSIHAFRMPVFFLLAAFLTAMMVEKAGARGMLRNRVKRLVLPFAAFWPLLFFAMGLLVLNYRHLMQFGTFGLNEAARPPLVPGRPLFSTMHMWFVYYLFLYCLVTAALTALAPRLPAPLKAGIARLVQTLAGRWWGVFVLALPLALAGSGYPYGMVAPYGSFIPNWPELINSGVFFLVGWYLYRERTQLLARFTGSAWLFIAAGWVPFIVCLKLFQVAKLSPDAFAQVEAAIAYLYGLCSWLWSFGLIGLFLRYLPQQNRFLRYVADSSYWVFLVHMLGTLGFGALLYNAPLGVAAKMGINIVATTAACMLTYHFFVRNTWIGVLLNGKKADARSNKLPLAAST